MSGILMASSGNYQTDGTVFVGQIFKTVGDSQLIIDQNYNSIQFTSGGEISVSPTDSKFTMSGASTSFAIECWIRPSTSGHASGNEKVIFSHLGGTDGYTQYYMYLQNGFLNAKLHSGSGAFSMLTSTVACNANSWTHVALTRDGTTVRMYQGGQLVASSAVSIATTNSTKFVIGGNSTTNGFFDGYISNFRVVQGAVLYNGISFTPSGQSLTYVPYSIYAVNSTYPSKTPITTLLTCQAVTPTNDHFDNSGNNWTINKSSSGVTPSILSPFLSATPQPTWSWNFNGIDDHLSIPYNSALTFGGGDFTIEYWLYPTRATSSNAIIAGIWDSSSSAPQSWVSSLTTTGNFIFVVDVAGADVIIFTSTNSINNGRWTHIAVTRSGSTWRLFINGILDKTTTNSSTISAGSALLQIGRYQNKAASDTTFNGYISDFRIVKSTAIYTSNFIPSNSPLTAIANTSLLTCQTPWRIVDRSPSNFSISVVQKVKSDTFSPFSSATFYKNWSWNFNGTNNAVTIPDNSAFHFGVENFTVEFWFNPTVVGSQWMLSQFESAAGVDSNSNFTFIFNSSKLRAIVAYNNSTAQINLDSIDNIVASSWYHAALVRNGSNLTLYMNGVSQSTSTALGSLSVNNSDLPINIGYRQGGSNYYNGLISNVRIVKGRALYTSKFTPSSSPLEVVTGTSLLTCQQGILIDNSVNIASISQVNNPTPIQMSPFTIETSSTVDVDYLIVGGGGGGGGVVNAAGGGGGGGGVISGSTAITPGSKLIRVGAGGAASVNGGTSMAYLLSRFGANFNGSSSYLSLPSNPEYAVGTKDFTVETWIYFSVATTWGPICQSDALGSSQSNKWYFAYYANTLRFSTHVTDQGFSVVASWTPIIGAWYHVAATRQNGIMKLFINGVMQTTSLTGTSAGFNLAQSGFSIGAISTPYYLKAQLSGFRFIVGTALYTNTFTISSFPLVAVTNTKILTCQDTSIAPVTNYSITFNESTDYLTAPNDQGHQFGSTPFTVEGWINAVNPSTVGGIIGNFQNGVNGWRVILNVGTLSYNQPVYGAENAYSTTAKLTANTWYHFAIVGNGTTIKFYVNGVVGDITCAQVASITSAGPLSIGKNADLSGGITWVFNGYLSNIRIVKGTAVYTSNFTPPTANLTKISGTTLLTANSSSIVDSSDSNLTLTKAGNPTVVATGPFGTAPPDPFLDYSSLNATITNVGTVSKVSTSPLYEAYGGGGGGIFYQYNSASSGLSGASGGGAVGYYVNGSTSAGQGIPGQGNSGGAAFGLQSSDYVYNGGGGGGAGAAGGTAKGTGGAGGAGKFISFMNSYYGGGGGGGFISEAGARIPSIGGNGGGGGGYGSGTAAASGAPNTGGGGGGGGGTGGSGVVAIRYNSKNTDTVFSNPGIYYYIVPDGVYAVSVVCVGAGAGSGLTNVAGNSSFSGGEIVGFGGSGSGGGSFVGQGGGAGGNGSSTFTYAGTTYGGSGGGAGGYVGAGATGVNSVTSWPPGGGGVSIYGRGPTGVNAVYNSGGGGSGAASTGGSYGTSGVDSQAAGGFFGGGSGGRFASSPANGAGGGGLGWRNTVLVNPGQIIPVTVGDGVMNYGTSGGGAWGAVRIISGTNRIFPDDASATIQNITNTCITPVIGTIENNKITVLNATNAVVSGLSNVTSSGTMVGKDYVITLSGTLGSAYTATIDATNNCVYGTTSTASSVVVGTIAAGPVCTTPTIGQLSINSFTIGQTYSGTITITNATSATITGLPTGIAFSGAPSGSNYIYTLFNSPSSGGQSYDIMVTATNTGSNCTSVTTAAQSVATGTVITSACTSPIVGIVTPNSFRAGRAYSGTITIQNATNASLHLINNKSPTGITMSGQASGANYVYTLTGTPTVDNESYNFRFNATNSGTNCSTVTVSNQSAGSGTVYAAVTCPATYDNVTVTGATSGGTVWGSGPYTDDSNLAMAAVHAGLVTVGETAIIVKTSAGYLSTYTGSTRNNVTSQSWINGWCGMNLSIICPTPVVGQLSPNTMYTGSYYSGYITITNATSATISGLPAGITAVGGRSGKNYNFSVNGTPSGSAGTGYNITVSATNNPGTCFVTSANTVNNISVASGTIQSIPACPTPGQPTNIIVTGQVDNQYTSWTGLQIISLDRLQTYSYPTRTWLELQITNATSITTWQMPPGFSATSTKIGTDLIVRITGKSVTSGYGLYMLAIRGVNQGTGGCSNADGPISEYRIRV